MKKRNILTICISLYFAITTLNIVAQVSDSVVEKMEMERGSGFLYNYSDWDTLRLTIDSFNISTGQHNSQLRKKWNNGVWTDCMLHKYTYNINHKLIADTLRVDSLCYVDNEYEYFLLYDSTLQLIF